MKERKQMFYEYIYNYVTLNLKPFYYWILMIKIIPIRQYESSYIVFKAKSEKALHIYLQHGKER